jgi:uncharacterized protein
MAVSPSYPGIYIQEAASSTHTITAAPTNIAVFIGYTHPLKTNPANWGKPVQVFGFSDYQRAFGGFMRSQEYAISGASQWITNAGQPTQKTNFADPATAPEVSFGDMASAVNQFFLNGGTEAYIVGLLPQTDVSNGLLGGSPILGGSLTFWPGLTFTALEITDPNFVMTVTLRPVSHDTSPPSAKIVDVIITHGPAPGPLPGTQAPAGTITETYRQVNITPLPPVSPPETNTDPNFIENRIGTDANRLSALVTVSCTSGPPAGSFNPPMAPITQLLSDTDFTEVIVTNNSIFGATDFTQVMQQDKYLDKLAVFNLMSIPGVTNSLVLSTAQAFCERHFAFLICDPPITDSADGSVPHFPKTIQDTINGNNPPVTIPESKNAALYFPYLLSPDPLTGQPVNLVTGTANEIPPSPTVAGVFAATDLSRGVWKAPAGFMATTNNVNGVVERGRMTNPRQGLLNPIGVNCLRDFPNIGNAVFGARTLVTMTDEQWRYVPVRRTALFLEQTLLSNLTWVIFEPNAGPLWSAITMSINAFMLGLFKQGAFQGEKPSQAFNVQCNSQTTTTADIDNGIVNIIVSFAPLKPAEFVVITIAQIAGQSQTS